jgi:hypothetical protein
VAYNRCVKLRASILLAAMTAALAALPAAGSTAAPPCPAKLPTTLVSSRPGAAGELVPPGAAALLLCAYRGLNPASSAGRLERSRLLGAGSELDWLVTTFDALRPSPPGIFCPMDDGTADLALFEYRSGPADPVTVALTGCRTAQNGHLGRTASLTPGPALLVRLGALLA